MPTRSRWTIPIPRVTVPTLLFGSPTASLSDKPAFIDTDRPETCFLTYSTFRLWAQRFAHGLEQAGLRPGDAVLLYSGNTLFFPVVILGTIMAGGVFTGANPSYTSREVAYQLKNSEAKFFICAEGALETGLAATKNIGFSNDKAFVFDEGYDTFTGRGQGRKGCAHWSALISTPDVGRDFRWKEDESLINNTVALNYSSGTTGLPKGVEITHINYVSNTKQQMYLAQLREEHQNNPDDIRYLCFLPMYHAMAQTIMCAGAPWLRVPVYIMKKFDFQKMLEAIQAFRISYLHLVPPIIVAMSKSRLVRKYDLSSVTGVTSGAAPLGSEVTKEFERIWPSGQVNVKQGYGMTETTCSALGWDPSMVSRSYSVGEVNANMEVKLVDVQSLREVAQGEKGEIWVKGPNIMKGYWKNPQATKSALTQDGWLRTGDIGIQDQNGLFFVVDRMKELIKVKGNQVAPAELEAQLLEHPGVTDAAVIGVQINGEELPRAYIVRSVGHQVSGEDIAKFMESRVARHKRLIGGVRFVDLIQKNPSGKILRRLYREQAAKEVGDVAQEKARL